MDRRVMGLQGSRLAQPVSAGFDPLACRGYPQLPSSAWYEPHTGQREIFRSDYLRLGSVRWELRDDRRSVFDLTRSQDREKERWLLPAPAGSDQAFEPITAWWILLFAMSILARYDPAAWSRALNVDQSDRAVRLQLLLDEALDVVPALVAAALLSNGGD